MTYESAAQRSASKTAAAILSGKFNKKFKEGTNVDDFIEVRYFTYISALNNDLEGPPKKY